MAQNKTVLLFIFNESIIRAALNAIGVSSPHLLTDLADTAKRVESQDVWLCVSGVGPDVPMETWMGQLSYATHFNIT